MTTRTTSLLATLVVVVFALPLNAAPKKAAAKSTVAIDAALAQALQVVSPDPLGGRLGLDLAIRKPDLALERRAQSAPATATTTPVVRRLDAAAKPTPTKS